MWNWWLFKNSMEYGIMIITIGMYKLSAIVIFCVGYKVLFMCRMKVSKVQWVSCQVLILLDLHKTLWTLCNVWNIQELTCKYLNHNPNNVILCDLVIYVIYQVMQLDEPCDSPQCKWIVCLHFLSYFQYFFFIWKCWKSNL